MRNSTVSPWATVTFVGENAMSAASTSIVRVASAGVAASPNEKSSAAAEDPTPDDEAVVDELASSRLLMAITRAMIDSVSAASVTAATTAIAVLMDNRTKRCDSGNDPWTFWDGFQTHSRR
jgi:hypothetical protein